MNIRPRWRKMTWVILGWVGLMAAWIAAGINQADCENETTDAAQLGCEAGTGLGVAALVVFGFLGFFALGLVWLMTQPRPRNQGGRPLPPPPPTLRPLQPPSPRN